MSLLLAHGCEGAAVLFSVQLANGNRTTQLRAVRDETRRLRRMLEAELGPAAR